MRVLVVDDSPFNRHVISDVLSARPEIRVVGHASNGEQALRMVAELEPDAITLDVEMPKMDGFTFLRILASTRPTPVLVVTFWSLVLSLVVCGLLSALFERDQWVRAPNPAEWGAIAYNSIVIFGFSQFMWFRLASILPPLASSLSVMLIPVIGLFSGMAMLGERPHWQDFAALAAILVAIATVLVPKAPARG